MVKIALFTAQIALIALVYNSFALAGESSSSTHNAKERSAESATTPSIIAASSTHAAKKRNANDFSTSTHGAQKRGADMTSTTAQAGPKKRHASTAAMDEAASTHSAHKRSAEMLSAATTDAMSSTHSAHKRGADLQSRRKKRHTSSSAADEPATTHGAHGAHKRNAEMTSTTPQAGRKRREVHTHHHRRPQSAQLAQAGRKRRHASTSAADESATTHGAHKRNAEMTSTTPQAGRRKRHASSMSMADEMATTHGAHKRDAMPTTTHGERQRRHASTSSEGTTTAGIHKRNAEMMSTTHKADRKKRHASSTADETSTTHGAHKRGADMTTDAMSSSTHGAHKRGADMMSTTTTSQAGRKKRHASTESTHSAQKRNVEMTSTTPSQVGRKKRHAHSTPDAGRKRRSAEMTSASPLAMSSHARKRRQMTTPPTFGGTNPNIGQQSYPAGGQGQGQFAQAQGQIGQGQGQMGQPGVVGQQSHGAQKRNADGISSAAPSTHSAKRRAVEEALEGTDMEEAEEAAAEAKAPTLHEDDEEKDVKSNRVVGQHAAAAEDGGPHHLPKPQFIKDLSPEQRRQFFEVKTNFTLTKKQMHDELQKWLKAQPASIQDDYKTFHENMEKMKDEISQKIQANLTSEGKTLFAKIKSLMEDDSLSMRETCEQIQSTIDAAPESVRGELHCNDEPVAGEIAHHPKRVDACHGHFHHHAGKMMRAFASTLAPAH